MILGHDFAVSGDTVQGVSTQVNTQFLPFAGRRPEWAPWTARDSVFCSSSLVFVLMVVTWIGINDINRWLDIPSQITFLFQLQEMLYDAGARKFVFLNVPPYNRSPWGTSSYFLAHVQRNPTKTSVCE